MIWLFLQIIQTLQQVFFWKAESAFRDWKEIFIKVDDLAPTLPPTKPPQWVRPIGRREDPACELPPVVHAWDTKEILENWTYKHKKKKKPKSTEPKTTVSTHQTNFTLRANRSTSPETLTYMHVQTRAGVWEKTENETLRASNRDMLVWKHQPTQTGRVSEPSLAKTSLFRLRIWRRSHWGWRNCVRVFSQNQCLKSPLG